MASTTVRTIQRLGNQQEHREYKINKCTLPLPSPGITSNPCFFSVLIALLLLLMPAQITRAIIANSTKDHIAHLILQEM